MKYRCKKTYTSYTDTIFEKDKWYEGKQIMDLSNVIYYQMIRSESRYDMTFDVEGFNKYFYSIDELREMEINKIIKQ
tara:strand:- start:868 stop:1098 length:231 start_codon:yes stop_codon:yes gene_type:complete